MATARSAYGRSDQNGSGHLGGSGFSGGGRARGGAWGFTHRCRRSCQRSGGRFDYRGQVPVERLAAAINSRLPDDVLIVDAAPAPEDFTPSCEAVTKQYSYTWAHGGKHGVLRPLFDRHFVAFSAYALDPAPMHEAAQSLVGTHDFLAFTKIDHGRETTVRTIHRCDVEGIDEHRLRIVVEGSGFLYNMVRIISGTLVEVGRGHREVEWVRAALASLDRSQSGPTAPAQGLCLEWLRYPDERWHWTAEAP